MDESRPTTEREQIGAADPSVGDDSPTDGLRDAGSDHRSSGSGVHMSSARFGAMIATPTIVMFGLTYLNTYAWDHVR